MTSSAAASPRPAVRVESADPIVLRQIGDGLHAFNEAAGGSSAPAGGEQDREFIVSLRDAEGRLVGGFRCDVYRRALFLEWAWIKEGFRGRGYGRAMLALAEEEALRRGAALAHLDTFDFQARGFYARAGYEVFGTLDYPTGARRFYMRKPLEAAAQP